MLRFGTLLGILVAACSSSSGTSIPYSDFDRAMQQARCERDARCGVFPDEEACLRYARIRPDHSLDAAVDAKVVRYDGERAQQCVEATAKQSCNRNAIDARVEPAACAATLTGTIAGGASCSFDIECESRTCELPTECPETGCCEGTCRPAQAAGGAGVACAKPTDCADGLVCGIDGECRAPSGETELCRNDAQCADGLGCVGATPLMAGRCRPLAGAGQPCPYLRCADDHMRCDEETHTCVAVGLIGAACPRGVECSSGLECDSATRLCREWPTLGMQCATSCGGDAFCYRMEDATVGTCIEPLANTTPCDGYNHCASFYCEQGPLFDYCRDQYICF